MYNPCTDCYGQPLESWSLTLVTSRGNLLVAGWSSDVSFLCVSVDAEPQLVGPLSTFGFRSLSSLAQSNTLEEHCAVLPGGECHVRFHCYSETPETRLLLKKRGLFTPQFRSFRNQNGIMLVW